MKLKESGARGSFGSKFGIIAAAAGSAVGLGNIWRFPYVAGENGGGAFLLIYIGFILLFGIPVMLSELMIGRSAQSNAYRAFKKLAPGKPWYIIGLMGITAAFVILAFYSTIAGWTLEYLYQSIINGFAGKDSQMLTGMFTTFQTSTVMPLFWQMVFLILTAIIVLLGVQGGIEKYSKILMPMLALIMIVLCVRSLTLPGAAQGLSFFFNPDFSKINAQVIFSALGQAAFSLSIGMGALITYGSYVKKNNNLNQIAIEVSLADTLIAILAGVVIFPAVFSFGISPTQGPGLVFIVLPNIFQQMAGGYFFAIMFFVLLVIAALTSSISILEVVVAFCVEEFKMKRGIATLIASIGAAIAGVFCTLSWGAFKDVSIFGKSIFDFFDFFSANILLPLGALLIVIFVGWVFGRKKAYAELSNEGTLRARFFGLVFFIVKFVAPLIIAVIFLNGLGIIKL